MNKTEEWKNEIRKNNFSIGSKVLFGRKKGEWTQGEIISSRHTEQEKSITGRYSRNTVYKIKTLELRGRKRTHAVGKIWSVHGEYIQVVHNQHDDQWYNRRTMKVMMVQPQLPGVEE